MFLSKRDRCDHRIVSMTGEEVPRVDHLRWDAFHEGHDLPSQVEAYEHWLPPRS